MLAAHFRAVGADGAGVSGSQGRDPVGDPTPMSRIDVQGCVCPCERLCTSPRETGRKPSLPEPSLGQLPTPGLQPPVKMTSGTLFLVEPVFMGSHVKICLCVFPVVDLG